MRNQDYVESEGEICICLDNFKLISPGENDGTLRDFKLKWSYGIVNCWQIFSKWFSVCVYILA